MRFWDASAIVALLVAEPESDELVALARADDVMVVWWGTPIECASALARGEREGRLDAGAANAALARLRLLEPSWAEVEPSPAVRRVAQRLLRAHALRAIDALQIAAALIVADPSPETLPFICLDERLANAARREGFTVGP